MAFVAAAQRAALAGVQWPTQGFDPQGRASLSGVITPEEATPDLTNSNRLAALSGVHWPSQINTAFGRGDISGVFTPEAGTPEVIIDVFQTQYDIVPTFQLVLPVQDGAIVGLMQDVTGSFGSTALTTVTLANIKSLAIPHAVTFADVDGVAVGINNAMFVSESGALTPGSVSVDQHNGSLLLSDGPPYFNILLTDGRRITVT